MGLEVLEQGGPVGRMELALILFVGTAALVGGVVGLFSEPRQTPYYVNDPTHWVTPDDSIVPTYLVAIYVIVLGICLLLFELGTSERAIGNPTVARWQTFRLFVMFLLCVILTGATTQILKVSIGALRPGFGRLCLGDENIPPPVYSPAVINSNSDCPSSVSEKKLNSNRNSFPSGHASLSFGPSFFLSLYIFWKAGVLRRKGLGAVSLIERLLSFSWLFPFWCGVLIGVSRIMDGHHFGSDVLAGFLVGAFYASFTFFLVARNIKIDYSSEESSLA